MTFKIGFSSEKTLLNLILLSKFLYIFIAEYIYTQFSLLGDTAYYLSSTSIQEFKSSTSFMRNLGFFSGMLPAPFYHIPLLLLSYYGIRYLLKTLSKYHLCNSKSDRFYFYIFTCSLSTGIWSSIHSKEAVGTFFMSIIIAFIIKVKLEKKIVTNPIETIALLLCFTFKPHYLIAIISIYIFLIIIRILKPKGGGQLSLIILIAAIQIKILLFFKKIIYLYSINIYNHFSPEEINSTRKNIFFNENDFFIHAPYGMYIGFIGPTFSEAYNRIIKLIFFIESHLLLFIIILYILKSLKNLMTFKLNIMAFSLLILSLFWILFAHYPFGVFNPGTAIRYRSNFMPFIIGMLLLATNYKKQENLVKN
jgi:hypothetical protein